MPELRHLRYFVAGAVSEKPPRIAPRRSDRSRVSVRAVA